MARLDLFQQVETYYREDSERDGWGADYARWLSTAREDLREAERYGADPAFLLHVLVCTRARRVRRHADQIAALRTLPPRKAAQLVGALKLLQQQGEAWLTEVFGPPQAERARTFLAEAGWLLQLLAGGTIETPAWQSGFLHPPTSRSRERALTACIVCVLDALKNHPKPAAATATLLEKFELLKGRTRGGISALAFVKARVRRSRNLVADRLGPVGNVIFHLTMAFGSLKEFLQPAPEIDRRAKL